MPCELTLRVEDAGPLRRPMPFSNGCRAVLAKYYIGDVTAEDKEMEQLYAEDELAEGTFYAVLKHRVSAYMRANRVQCFLGLALATCAPSVHLMPQMRREGGAVAVAPGATSAHMTQLIMPQHANSLGITFGGARPSPTMCTS